MATQFEFRLIDADAREGELEADQLLAIVHSLKDVAMKLSRAETDAEHLGRPPTRTQRVARLSIGLAPGSTRVLVRRSTDDDGALPIELAEEKAFDEKFDALVQSIAEDQRPDWVSDTLAVAAGNLRTALEDAAPTVEFRAGEEGRTFITKRTHRHTWADTGGEPQTEVVSFVGRLRAVNLDTHRLQVTDDVGNRIALPNVPNDSTAGRLLGDYVTAVGTPERDSLGRLTRILGAVVEPAASLSRGVELGAADGVPLVDILASAPGPTFDGVLDLTSDQADAFLDALGL